MKLSLLTVIFILVCFNVFKILYVTSEGESLPVPFPTFDPDFPAFPSISDCDGVFDCVGTALISIFLLLFSFGAILIEIIRFQYEFVAFLTALQFVGVAGAPWWLNVVLSTPLILVVVFVLYLLIRSGKASASE